MKVKGMNLLRDGYEAVAESVAKHIKTGRIDYTVSVKPSGAVLVAAIMNQRFRREQPPEWFVGNYKFDGLRTEHIEDDLLERERELKAIESQLSVPKVRASKVGNRPLDMGGNRRSQP